MNADEMALMVKGIIAKSGGIEKWRELRDVIQDLKQKATSDKAYSRFVAGIAKSDKGSRQLVAIALLGLTLGDVVWMGDEARREKI